MHFAHLERLENRKHFDAEGDEATLEESQKVADVQGAQDLEFFLFVYFC